MDSQVVLVRTTPPLGGLVINRPEVRNALNLAAWRALAEGARTLEADPDVRVIVVCGSTNAAFIAGADIPSSKRSGPTPSRPLSTARPLTPPLMSCRPVPNQPLQGSLPSALALKYCWRSISGSSSSSQPSALGTGLIRA